MSGFVGWFVEVEALGLKGTLLLAPIGDISPRILVSLVTSAPSDCCRCSVQLGGGFILVGLRAVVIRGICTLTFYCFPLSFGLLISDIIIDSLFEDGSVPHRWWS